MPDARRRERRPGCPTLAYGTGRIPIATPRGSHFDGKPYGLVKGFQDAIGVASTAVVGVSLLVEGALLAIQLCLLAQRAERTTIGFCGFELVDFRHRQVGSLGVERRLSTARQVGP